MGSRLNSTASWARKNGKRVAVAVVGLLLVVAGLVLMITPGPGLLVVIAGLAVLATEFAWARGLLVRVKAKARQARARLRRRKTAS